MTRLMTLLIIFKHLRCYSTGPHARSSNRLACVPRELKGEGAQEVRRRLMVRSMARGQRRPLDAEAAVRAATSGDE